MTTPVEPVAQTVDMRGRIRRVMVREIDVLTAFSAAANGHQYLCLPVFTALPPGYDVRSVHYDHAYRSFVFIVSHVEFSEVPAGGVIPSLAAPWAMGATTYVRVGEESR